MTSSLNIFTHKTTVLCGYLFVLVLLGLSFIAILAVFARSGIDTWIQFSLYIVPLFSMICGHLIFKSHSFKEILNRRIEQNGTNETEFGTSTVSSFLQKRSMRTCFYPVSLVVYQWAVYLMFFYDERSSEFSGPFNISQHSSSVTRFLHLDLKKRLWLPLYYTFWTIAMYVTGFVGCCFILVVEIHKLDIKSFLYNIGNGPLIHKGKSLNCHSNVHRKTRITNHGVYQAVDTGVTTPAGLCFRALSLFTGFLTLGLVELVSWETHKMPGISGHEVAQNVAGEISDSGVANGLTSSVAVENGQGTSSSEGRGVPPKTISPRDVSKHLVELMSSVETNSALFKPFLVLLTFFFCDQSCNSCRCNGRCKRNRFYGPSLVDPRGSHAPYFGLYSPSGCYGRLLRSRIHCHVSYLISTTSEALGS